MAVRRKGATARERLGKAVKANKAAGRDTLYDGRPVRRGGKKNPAVPQSVRERLRGGKGRGTTPRS
jgi:hypothetical protein